MNRFDQLTELQSIDIRIDENLKSRREVEARLNDEGGLAASKGTVDLTDRHAHEIRARIRAMELEVKGVDDKIKEVLGRLYDGRTSNPKELSGLEQDVEMLRRRKREIEDQMLEAMVELEAVEAELSTDRAGLEKVTAETTNALDHARAELEILTATAAKLSDARAHLCSLVSPSDLTIYESLRHEKKGRALAHIKGSSCDVCGFSVPSGLASRVRVGQQLEFCSNCGRILLS